MEQILSCLFKSIDGKCLFRCDDDDISDDVGWDEEGYCSCPCVSFEDNLLCKHYVVDYLEREKVLSAERRRMIMKKIRE